MSTATYTEGQRVYVTRPAYGKPFYGKIRFIYRNSGKPHDEGVYSSYHGKLEIGYLIQRSENSGALWYDASDFRPLKRKA